MCNCIAVRGSISRAEMIDDDGYFNSIVITCTRNDESIYVRALEDNDRQMMALFNLHDVGFWASQWLKKKRWSLRHLRLYWKPLEGSCSWKNRPPQNDPNNGPVDFHDIDSLTTQSAHNGKNEAYTERAVKRYSSQLVFWVVQKSLWKKINCRWCIVHLFQSSLTNPNLIHDVWDTLLGKYSPKIPFKKKSLENDGDTSKPIPLSLSNPNLIHDVWLISWNSCTWLDI